MIPEFTDGFFCTSATHGFLPMHDPLEKLPDEYHELQTVVEMLPFLIQPSEDDAIGKAVIALPEYTMETIDDVQVMAALYRAYCFVASAYLLYPAHVEYQKTKTYGVARDRLPRNLAQPLLQLASQLDVLPWLEYSFGYSLGNFVRINANDGLDYTNLRMACSFTGSTDETGFIMVHVDINQHTPSLLTNCDALLEAWRQQKDPTTALEDVRQVLMDMNASRKKMWEASRWERYNDFRVFIMGSEGNPKIFPHGVLYEPETEPRYYRGQSGSQDTILPFVDTLFRVSDHYPENELTGYLIDMRKYRPKPFRDLLEWTDKETRGLVDFIMLFEEAATLLCGIYQEIYDFRNGHWHFVQKYIMANTRYPVATGGTPIVSWLPNQIHATLNAMKRVVEKHPKCREAYTDKREELETQIKAIDSFLKS